MKVINYNINYNQAKTRSMKQFILFEALLNDDFSTDRIIFDKTANIEERESNLINFLRNVQ